MTLNEAVQILKDHNEWRLGADTQMSDPKALTEAIDIAINTLSGMKSHSPIDPEKLGSVEGEDGKRIERAAEEYWLNTIGDADHNVTTDAFVAGAEYATQSLTTWIPVSERLPERYEGVIVYGRYTRDIRHTVYEATFDPKNRTFNRDGIRSKDVTHWQPLPEPPKP